ncbi:MAG: O-antigen ligase family protein [Chloroflexota bacterium]|nr:O-antigen ligase family protein [Chloroflexota bacterium]
MSEPQSGVGIAAPQLGAAPGSRAEDTEVLSGSVDFAHLASVTCFVASLAIDGRLTIQGDQWMAELVFNAGQLTDATCGADHSRSALQTVWLLAARSTRRLLFTFWPANTSRAGTMLIDRDELAQSLGLISSEAMRVATLVPSLEWVPRAAIHDVDPSGIVLLSRTALALLVRVDGQTPVAQLVREHGQWPTLSALVCLIEEGLVVVAPPLAPSRWSATQRGWRRLQGRAGVVEVGGWTALGTILGGVSWFAPVTAALALGAAAIGLPLVCTLWRRAELGLLGLLALTAGLLRASDLYLRLPLGGLYPADLALVMLLAVVSLRAVFHDGLSVGWLPVNGPLIGFLVVCAGSAAYAATLRGVPIHQALNEVRPIAFYGVALVTMLAVRRPKDLTTLLFGLFLLADVIALALVLQQFAGAGNKLLPGMDDWQVNAIGAAGATNVGGGQTGFGSVRVVPPASLLLFFLMVFAFVRMLTSRPSVRPVYVVQFAVLNVGLLLTYTRAQWLASVLALGLSTLMLPGAARRRLVRAVPAVVLILGLCVTPFAAGVEPPGSLGPFLSALVSRATSTLAPAETLASPSLQWRGFEMEQALRSIAAAPQGVGLGNTYRSVTTLAGEAAGYQGAEPLNRFVHNSYLYIAVKTGLLGLAIFVWFCLAFVVSSWRLLRRLPEGRYRWLTLAAMASFVGIMQWSLTEANFMQTGSTAVVGLMVGIVACAARAASEADPRLVRAP